MGTYYRRGTQFYFLRSQFICSFVYKWIYKLCFKHNYVKKKRKHTANYLFIWESDWIVWEGCTLGSALAPPWSTWSPNPSRQGGPSMGGIGSERMAEGSMLSDGFMMRSTTKWIDTRGLGWAGLARSRLYRKICRKKNLSCVPRTRQLILRPPCSRSDHTHAINGLSCPVESESEKPQSGGFRSTPGMRPRQLLFDLATLSFFESTEAVHHAWGRL